VVGLEVSTSSKRSEEAEQTSPAQQGNDIGQPITAMTVRRRENRVPKGGGPVSATAGSVRDPFTIVETSDWRSVREYSLFKEGKRRLMEYALLNIFPEEPGAFLLRIDLEACWWHADPVQETWRWFPGPPTTQEHRAPFG
jgi:hypothetical protein